MRRSSLPRKPFPTSAGVAPTVGRTGTRPARRPALTDPHPPAFITRPPARVLFLCIHNSARSQIAEAFARRLAPRGTEVWSAGTAPSRVHPDAIRVMAEAGLTLEGHTSKSLDEVPWRTADTVVTLCDEAATACPTLPGPVRRVHWPLPDPSAAPEASRLEAFRRIRDEIRWRVSALWPRADDAAG